MNIALFGATGGTGRQVLDQALAQGHLVSALVRDPAKLAERKGLTLVVGDVLDRDATTRCIQGTDAVICVLGSHGSREPIEALGTRSILDAMRDNGVRRLIAVTSLGVGDSRAQINWALSDLVALLRWNLFTHRDLWAWLNKPFDTPALPFGPQQMELMLDSN